MSYSKQSWADGVAGNTPITAARLSHIEDGVANSVVEGSAFADVAKQSGVDPTGATECAAALQAALDACAATGTRAYARGTFKIASTITINADVDLGDSTFNYSGGGQAVRVGTISAATFRLRNIRLPRIINTAKTSNGWAQAGVAGSVGVKIVNCYSCEISIPHVQGFAYGLLIAGANSNGTAYTDIRLGWLDNNQINCRLANDDSTGWANQNNVFGGRMSHNSNEGTVVSGTRHIQIATATSIINGNVFHGTSIESPNVVEYHLDCAGNDNYFLACRWENTGPAPRVNWAANSKGNQIVGGYDSFRIVETRGSGSQNEVVSRVIRRIIGGDSTHATTVFENPNSSSAPQLQGMTAGGWAAGDDETSQWLWRLTGQSFAGKQHDDSTPRLMLDFVNGWIRSGAAVTGSRPSASTAGAAAMFYDTTLGKPIWSNGSVWKDATGATV